MKEIRDIKDIERRLDILKEDIKKYRNREENSDTRISGVQRAINELKNELTCSSILDTHWEEGLSLLHEIIIEDSQGYISKGNIYITRESDKFNYEFRDRRGNILYESRGVDMEDIIYFIESESSNIYEGKGKYILKKKEHPEDYNKIPDRILKALERYVEDKICPGDFLKSTLENDLYRSISFADDDIREGLPQLVVFIHTNLPYKCWGNRDNVKAWLEK